MLRRSNRNLIVDRVNAAWTVYSLKTGFSWISWLSPIILFTSHRLISFPTSLVVWVKFNIEVDKDQGPQSQIISLSENQFWCMMSRPNVLLSSKFCSIPWVIYSSWRIAESSFAELGYIVLAKELRNIQAYCHSYVKLFFFFF